MKFQSIRTIVAGGTLCFLLASCEKTNISPTEPTVNTTNVSSFKTSEICGGVVEYSLLAGQYIESGSIYTSNDDENLYISYNTIDGWELKKIHLYIGTIDGLPTTNNGNPKIGQFPIKANFQQGTTTYNITIPRGELSDCVVIAAHAEVVKVENGQVVQSETAWSEGEQINDGGSWATFSNYCFQDCETCTVENFEANLPTENGNITITPNSLAYITTSLSNAGQLSGTFPGYCVDVETSIKLNTNYSVKIISSYSQLIETLGVVDKPENLPQINYILNQNYVGKIINGSAISGASVQVAIWRLIDNTPRTWTGYNEQHVQFILNEVAANGANYIPIGCDSLIAVILYPIDENGSKVAQVTIIAVPLGQLCQ